MNSADYSALEGLQIADPETYVWVKGRVALMSPPPSQETLALLVEETIWGLSLEAGLGRAVAEGGLLLITNGAGQRLTTFVEMVHHAAGTGVTLGRLTATFAAPVLAGGADLLDKFQQALVIKPDLTPALGNLANSPVLILRGELSDLFSAATCDAMMAGLNNAEAVTVPGVGHAPLLTEPEAEAGIDRLLAKVA